MKATSPTQRGQRSRRAIIDAASSVFARHGYVKASLNEIIRESGLTKGAFYFHFPSKQALALAVVLDGQERVTTAVLRSVSLHERAVDRLFDVPRQVVTVLQSDETCLAQDMLVAEMSRDPALRAELTQPRREWLARTERQFREAQAEGTVRDDVDPAVLAEVAIGGFMGMQALTDELGDDALRRRVEALIAVVQLAVLTRPS
jgi:AcrR family transcriptional regulator